MAQHLKSFVFLQSSWTEPHLGVQEYLLFDPLLEVGFQNADIVFTCPSLHPQVLPWIYIDVDAVCKGKCWYIVSWITS